jgi:hypothetical protein
LRACLDLPYLSPNQNPVKLVAEPEPSQALSVRKLVLETAKHNVLTAHSTREALDLFHLFPNVSMAVLVGDEGETLLSLVRSVLGDARKQDTPSSK